MQKFQLRVLSDMVRPALQNLKACKAAITDMYSGGFAATGVTPEEMLHMFVDAWVKKPSEIRLADSAIRKVLDFDGDLQPGLPDPLLTRPVVIESTQVHAGDQIVETVQTICAWRLDRDVEVWMERADPAGLTLNKERLRTEAPDKVMGLVWSELNQGEHGLPTFDTFSTYVAQAEDGTLVLSCTEALRDQVISILFFLQSLNSLYADATMPLKVATESPAMAKRAYYNLFGPPVVRKRITLNEKPVKVVRPSSPPAHPGIYLDRPTVESQVRGHFRRQPCGPGRSQVKLVYIEPFKRKAHVSGKPHVTTVG